MLKSFKRLRLVAAGSFVGALALAIPMAAPASAATGTTWGIGIASGIVQGVTGATTACTKGGGYVFRSVGITGATLDTATTQAGVGSTGFDPTAAVPTANQPAGSATGDPLDGTPLGCGASDVPNIWTTVSSAAPVGTPVVGCPGGTIACGNQAGASNILADEGVVTGNGAADFVCNGAGAIPNVGGTIRCSLHGTFVRFGGTVLVFLTGCVQVANGPGLCSGKPADVAVASQVVPLPVDPTLPETCPPVPALGRPLFCHDAFAGPFVITPHQEVFGNNDAVQTALDTLYCPAAAVGRATHTAGAFPPAANCSS